MSKAVWIPLAAGIGGMLGAGIMRLNAGPVPMTWNAVQGVTAVLALIAAVAAWTLTLETYRNSYVPIVRAVPAKLCGGGINLHAVILKNIGRGTAISIVLAAGSGNDESSLAAELDALEPRGELYGPNFVESSRVGRIAVKVNPPLQAGGRYRLIFQDAAGDWHETAFTVDPLRPAFIVRLLGRRQPEEVPNWIKSRAQVVTA